MSIKFSALTPLENKIDLEHSSKSLKRRSSNEGMESESILQEQEIENRKKMKLSLNVKNKDINIETKDEKDINTSNTGMNNEKLRQATLEAAKYSPLFPILTQTEECNNIPTDVILLCIEYTISYASLAKEYERQNNWSKAYTCAVLAMEVYEPDLEDGNDTVDEKVVYLAGCAHLYGLNTIKVNLDRAIELLEYASTMARPSSEAMSLLAQIGHYSFSDARKYFNVLYDDDDPFGIIFGLIFILLILERKIHILVMQIWII